MIIDFYPIGGGGSGSGSTYVLPTATENRLGGVKIGSGISVENDGTISVSGGTTPDLSGYTTTAVTAELSAATSGIAVDLETLSAYTATIPTGSTGGGDYLIVNALSSVTDPTEGMLVYKKERTYVETTEYYKIQRNPDADIDGDVGDIKDENGGSIPDTRVYQSGSNFEWDWRNNGQLNEKKVNYNQNTIEYKTYNDSDNPKNNYFLFKKGLGGMEAEGWYVDANEYSTKTDYSETGYTTEYGTFYQYHNSGWTQLYIRPVIDFNSLTSAEGAALYSSLTQMSYKEINRVFTFFATIEIEGNSDAYKLEYIGIRDGYLLFGSAVPNFWNMNEELKMPQVRLGSDGEREYAYGAMRTYHTAKLSIRRDSDYLGYDSGSYSGYTLDFTNVADYTEGAANWQDSNNEWIFKVNKWEGTLKNGDWGDYEDDNKLHYRERDLSGVKYQYYYKRTGMTLTILFVINPPSSIGDLNLNQDVTYSAEAATAVNYYWTNREDQTEFFTGNTASDEWQFEYPGISQFANGEGDDNQVPKLALRIRKNDGKAFTTYGNPVIKYERFAENIVLYDKNNEPRNFNVKFYFYYGDYTVSLLAGEANDYRYAQLTITSNA